MMDFATKIMTAPLGKTYIFSVGQAGFIIKSANGQLLGIDLYLSDCGERIEGHIGFKRLLPKILGTYDIDFDCIIATHPHFDHFDMDAIPQLMSNGTTKLYASVNCASDVERLKMSDKNITYIAPHDERKCGDFNLYFTSCDHGALAPDAVGIIVEVDGRRIIEVGDTCLRLDYANEFVKYGCFDVLIAPINGAYGNLDEADCATLAGVLRPKITVPCHYGMFASHGGNPQIFQENMMERYPDLKYTFMQLGECMTILD